MGFQQTVPGCPGKAEQQGQKPEAELDLSSSSDTSVPYDLTKCPHKLLKTQPMGRQNAQRPEHRLSTQDSNLCSSISLVV